MARLMLDIFEDNTFPIETAVCLSVYEYTTSSLKIIFVKRKGEHETNKVKYELLEETRRDSVTCESQVYPTHTTLPTVIFPGNRSYIAGLAAVLRKIVKCSSLPYLLGFRSCCLGAPAEVSCWTRFCEVDIIKCLEKLILNPPESYQLDDIRTVLEESSTKSFSKEEMIFNQGFTYSYLPEELGTLEYHLSIPAKVHNKEKYGVGGPKHDFVEGPTMVLSDLVIALCAHLILDYLNAAEYEKLPFTLKWLHRLQTQRSFSSYLDRVANVSQMSKDKAKKWLIPIFKTGPFDLYKKEGTRRKKRFTQGDLLSTSLDVISEIKLMEYSEIYNITDLELESMKVALPEVPMNRLDRKVQQLTNLAKATLAIAKDGDVIVDMCCGSGHLGILLATLLPVCHVILLDNKESSLERATSRVLKMNLSNVQIVQSNLDYFIGQFQIGVSLHACGVASDIVINKCLTSKAHLVLCPCCYGGIKSNHIVHYPQSDAFKNAGLSEHDFFVLAHNADTCNKDSGHIAMTSIDTDRCLYLSQQGYSVTLSKLQPVDCTTRNNLIVAVSSS